MHCHIGLVPIHLGIHTLPLNPVYMTDPMLLNDIEALLKNTHSWEPRLAFARALLDYMDVTHRRTMSPGAPEIDRALEKHLRARDITFRELRLTRLGTHWRSGEGYD